MLPLNPNFSLTAPVIPPKPKPKLTLIQGGKETNGPDRLRTKNP
jgi:hypothetical protein